jgi:hypothetical protein
MSTFVQEVRLHNAPNRFVTSCHIGHSSRVSPNWLVSLQTEGRVDFYSVFEQLVNDIVTGGGLEVTLIIYKVRPFNGARRVLQPKEMIFSCFLLLIESRIANGAAEMLGLDIEFDDGANGCIAHNEVSVVVSRPLAHYGARWRHHSRQNTRLECPYTFAQGHAARPVSGYHRLRYHIYKESGIGIKTSCFKRAGWGQMATFARKTCIL